MKMKRIFAIVVSLILCLGVFAACQSIPAGDKDNILKIYVKHNVDQNLVNTFEEQQQTTNPNFKIVRVDYQTDEELYEKIAKNNEDFDLVLASDYMIKELITDEKIMAVDTNQIANYDNISEFITKNHQLIDGGEAVYSVGYSYGTLGLLYNSGKVNSSDISNNGWDILWNSSYNGKVSISNNMRDAYTVASIYANKEELKQYTVGTPQYINAVTSILNGYEITNIEKVQNAWKSMKSSTNPFLSENNISKLMINGDRLVSVMRSDDASKIIDDAYNTNTSLKYVVPEKGSTLWFDGWVMPKTGKNNAMAYKFMSYMLDSNSAIETIKNVGINSVVKGGAVISYLASSANDATNKSNYESANLKYLFGDTPGAQNLLIQKNLYPSFDIINNCSMIVKAPSDSAQSMLETSWNDFKFNALPIILIVVGSFVGAVLIIFVSIILYKKFSNKKKFVERSQQGKRNKDEE